MGQAIPNTPNEMENKVKVKPALPSAFPGTGYGTGMTLRDYFAAKAMQAVMACDEAESYEWIAKKAYNLADFMLIARKQ